MGTGSTVAVLLKVTCGEGICMGMQQNKGSEKMFSHGKWEMCWIG